MAAASMTEPRLHAAVQSSVKALRRMIAYRMPPALDRKMLELGERKEFISPEEHEQLMALVEFSEERSAEKLEAELALKQLQGLFPEEAGK